MSRDSGATAYRTRQGRFQPSCRRSRQLRCLKDLARKGVVVIPTADLAGRGKTIFPRSQGGIRVLVRLSSGADLPERIEAELHAVEIGEDIAFLLRMSEAILAT